MYFIRKWINNNNVDEFIYLASTESLENATEIYQALDVNSTADYDIVLLADGHVTLQEI